MILETKIVELLEPYTSISTIYDLKSIKIKLKDNKALKLFCLPKQFYRKYFLELNASETKIVGISFKEKETLKTFLPDINYYLKTKSDS